MVDKRVGGGWFAHCAAVGAAAMFLTCTAAQAQQFVYGNSASAPNNQWLYKIDKTTGAVVKACQMNKGNGRGIVVVNNIAYYTTAGTNKAFYYTPTGTLLATIALANCTGFCDGLEFFNGKLISNRGDASTTGY